MLTPGEIVPRTELEREKREAKDEGGTAPDGNPLLLGITAASLASESWLAAASFQETSRVLIRSALAGAIDPLARLKENIIIGRLIPAGTGYRREYAADAYVGTIPEEPIAGPELTEMEGELKDFAMVASETEGGDFPEDATQDSEEKEEQVEEMKEGK